MQSTELSYRRSKGVYREAHTTEATKKILKNKGLWEYRKSIVELPTQNDPLDLGVTSIKVSAATGGPKGEFLVEAFKCCSPIVSFRWNYRILGDDEVWSITANRIADEGDLYSAEAFYGVNGIIFDNISGDDFLIRSFEWLVRGTVENQNLTPFWMGSFAASADKLALITKDTCPACDSGWCNCE